MDERPAGIREVEDTDVDRYPNAFDVLSAIQHDGLIPNGPIERLEVTTLASGEITYRVWAPRAEEPEGGYIPQL